VNSEEILEINKNYLKHFYTTDIITFNYSGDNKNLEGEIFISLPDAKENALKFNVDFNQELLRLITHGMLHLLGYDDEEPEKKKIMKKLENKLVNDLSNADEKYRIV
jgi:rRNA maturation RNase YbeY